MCFETTVRVCELLGVYLVESLMRMPSMWIVVQLAMELLNAGVSCSKRTNPST